MASVTAYTSIKDAISTNLAPVPVLDFDTLDEAQYQSDTAFIALEEIAQDEDLVAFGANLCYRELGVIVAHHFTVAPESSATARQFAQNTQDLLRQQVLSSGVRIIAVDPPEPTFSNNGRWTLYSLPISYELDTVRAHPTPLP